MNYIVFNNNNLTKILQNENGIHFSTFLFGFSYLNTIFISIITLQFIWLAVSRLFYIIYTSILLSTYFTRWIRLGENVDYGSWYVLDFHYWSKTNFHGEYVRFYENLFHCYAHYFSLNAYEHKRLFRRNTVLICFSRITRIYLQHSSIQHAN